jgi:Hydrogenase maturation factor
MEFNKYFSCQKCNARDFTIIRESTYVYSYKYHSTDGNIGDLPFLFDNRENTNNKEFIRCDNCGERYPIDLENFNGKISTTILQKAIRSDLVKEPEFWG